LTTIALPTIGQKPKTATIPLLPPAQMAASDVSIVVRSQSAIAESAQFYGYTLDSSYKFRKIVCPFVPEYLLLTYESAEASGSFSRFTAIVSRDAVGSTAQQLRRIEIIPILHFGVVPFIPAYSTPTALRYSTMS
jgi:hypothetical protein